MNDRAARLLDLDILQDFYTEICGIPAVYEIQNVLARRMLDQVRHHTMRAGIAPAPAANPTVMEALKGEGTFVIGPILPPQTVQEVREAAARLPVYNGEMFDRSDRVPRALEDLRRSYRLGGYKVADILRLPHLLELANDPRILSVVESYIGACPTIAFTSLWWSFPETEAGGPMPTELIGQRLHRDIDDFRGLTLFAYLTDVDAERGAQRYFRCSHDLERFREILARKGPRRPDTGAEISLIDTFVRSGLDVGDSIGEACPELIRLIEGPAGTIFLTDTHGFHCGTPLQRGERLLFVVRYGLSGNINRKHLRDYVPARFDDFAARIGDSPKARYVNRLLLA